MFLSHDCLDEIEDAICYEEAIELLQNNFSGQLNKLTAKKKLSSIRKHKSYRFEDFQEKVKNIDKCVKTLFSNRNYKKRLEETVFYSNKLLAGSVIQHLNSNEKYSSIEHYLQEPCGRCNFTSHKTEECRSKYKWDLISKQKITLTTIKSKNKTKTDLSDFTVEKATVYNHKIWVSLDTCANVDTISEKLAKKLGLKKNTQHDIQTIHGNNPIYSTQRN
uniref:DUF1758 domain-containing protein n=1 Tax=Strongyloides papillosus TaxID=174720 RepID=A0A0N5BUA1_STREA